MRRIVDACADCDTCRYLMDESCLLFPRLYQGWDAQCEARRPITRQALFELADSCTLCGLCPCFNIRNDVVKAKAERVAALGMPMGVRLLADVQRFARLGGSAPRLVNRLLAIPALNRVLKKLLDIHPQRELPPLAAQSFFDWARRKGLQRHPHGERKVAYFAGCTAGYLFPEVARAAVAVLNRNGVAVHVPDQQCCGMPTLLEGDRATTLKRARFNLATLGALAEADYDIVCSCPTCGYLLKVLLKENACYSAAYQESVQAGADELLVPDTAAAGGATAGGDGERFIRVKKSLYAAILCDDGLFAGLDPLGRIALSARVYDLGEYLAALKAQGRFDGALGGVNGHMVYYAPCHQREQAMGSPYLNLLKAIPDLAFQSVGGPMDCCGMGGSLGYKRQFHADALRLGRPLMQKIAAAAPAAIVTDCLSCRLQFRHRLPYAVWHPLELLQRAYGHG